MAADSTNAQYRRRFVWLASAIVAIIALYSGGWYYVAGLVDSEVEKALAGANRNGMRINCENRRVNGYPFRIGLNCDSVLVESAVDGLSFSAHAFRTAAQVYNPSFMIAEIDSPASLEAPGLMPLALDWDLLRSSVRLARPLPARISAETRMLRASASEGERLKPLFVSETAEAHMQPDGDALDFAAIFNGLLIEPGLFGSGPLPALQGGADLSVNDGVKWLSSGSKSFRGRSGQVRRIYVSPGEGSEIDATGSFDVGEDGLLNAKLAIKVRGAKALSQTLIAAFPQSEAEIASFAASLEALGENAELPLRVVKGRIIYGFLELGEVPPLP